MIIKPNTQEVVYITIHDMTFYIDYSLDEPIVEMWKKSEEIITLTPDNQCHYTGIKKEEKK
jgi:hypothetical protein